MVDNIIVSEVEGPLDVVRCFVREEDGLQGQKRQLVVVGLEYIDVFEGVERGETCKVLSLRTDGCTVAAFYYKDHSIVDRRFYILLKATGRLDFIDINYKLVKSLETQIDQVRSEPKFLFQDPLRPALVFNLSRTEIYEISTKDILNLAEADIKLSYITSSPIVSIDACINFNDILDKDVFTLSILTHPYGANGYELEACMCAFEPKPAKGAKWQRTIKVSFTDEAAVSQILLKSVANIGNFVFTPWKIYSVKHALSSNQTIGGEKIGTIYQGSGAFASEHTQRIDLLRPILAEVTLNYLTFTFLTHTAVVITCKMNAISSSFEDDTYIWENFSFEKLPRNNAMPIKHYLSAFFDENYWILVCPEGHITMCSIGNEDRDSSTALGSLLCKSTLYSDFIGSYTRSHLSCGLLYNGLGFLRLKFQSYMNIFAGTSMKLIFQTENGAPRQVYSTRKGIYWADADNNIYRGSVRIDSKVNDNFIATRDGTLLTDKSIVTFASIRKDKECNYVYVTKQGRLKWSHSQESYQIQNLHDKLTIENCCLSAISRGDDSPLTVLVLNDEMIVFDSCNQLKSRKKTFNSFNNLSSIFLHEYENMVYIFVSDVEGTLCIIKAATLELLEKVKICKKKLQFCEVPNSEYVFIYTADTTVLLKPCSAKAKFEIHEVHAPYHISHIVPGEKDGTVIMVTSQGRFYDVTVPSYVGKATFSSALEHVSKPCFKFVTLESSSRYIIVAALPVAKQLQDRYSEIYVYDIKQVKKISVFNFFTINNDIKSIKYENVLISDIISVPVIKRSETLAKKKTSELYKEVIFNSCILVALNLNSIDDIDSNDMNNLMLFSFDEKSGAIEYLFGINTGFSITGLYNYYNGCVLVYGESVQAYQLNYSVHEDKFSIEQVSNRLHISGVAIILSILFDEGKAKMARKQRNIDTWVYLEKMVLLDIRKGMMRFNVIHTTDGNVENILLQVHSLDPLERELVDSVNDGERMITGSATTTFKNTRYLLNSYGSQNLTLFRYTLDGEERIDQTVHEVAAQVTTVKSVGTNDFGIGAFLDKATFTPLFLVNTLGNGCYVIGFLHEESAISSYKLSEEKATFTGPRYKFFGFLTPQKDNHAVISGS